MSIFYKAEIKVVQKPTLGACTAFFPRRLVVTSRADQYSAVSNDSNERLGQQLLLVKMKKFPFHCWLPSVG